MSGSGKATDGVLPTTLLTALAPLVWGSTYLVATEWLNGLHPLTVAMLRALPVGLILLLFLRRLPHGHWWWRVFILGTANFTLFWSMLFISAFRLPGGVAATLGAVQPLMVVLLSSAMFRTPISRFALVAAVAGVAGVALLVLTPAARLDGIGIAAGLIGTLSMAVGTLLGRRWRAPVPLLTFTAWQLTAGGLMLVPLVLWLDPLPAAFTAKNLLGLVYLGAIGAGLTYWLWFSGLQKLSAMAVSSLALLSPVSATVLGWLVLDQRLNGWQLAGAATVLASVWLGQLAGRASSA